jgi:uncharacterized HAD superfamily protein
MMVGLDIDGVLADFISPFLRRMEQRVENGPIDAETITDLTFKSHPHLTERIVSECLMEVSNEPAFWRDLAPLPSPNQWKTLESLSRNGRLVFLTHRYERDSYDIHQITSDWLKTHGISNPTVYFTQKEKSELVEKLKVQLFVDDRHENCQDVAEKTRAIVLMPHRPYNQFFRHPRVRRIRSLDELFAQLG